MKEYKFGLEEIKGMLKEMIVLVDSREQKNAHILDYFQRQGIPYEVEKLDYGDYSCNKEESAILQHDNTGVGADAPGIYKHDTRAADRDGLRAGDGNLCTRTGAEVFGDFGGLKRNLLTRQRAGSIPIFPTP